MFYFNLNKIFSETWEYVSHQKKPVSFFQDHKKVFFDFKLEFLLLCNLHKSMFDSPETTMQLQSPEPRWKRRTCWPIRNEILFMKSIHINVYTDCTCGVYALLQIKQDIFRKLRMSAIRKIQWHFSRT